MNPSASPAVAWICGTILLLAILGGIFALAWHGTITGAVVAGIVVSVIGIAGGLFGVHVGANAAVNAKQDGS